MSKIDLSHENEDYFDALGEIGNIGAGNAMSALAQMLGRPVEVYVPKVKLLDFKDAGSAIGGEEQIMAGIYLLLDGDVSGSMMLMLKKESAAKVAGVLMGDPDRDVNKELSDMEI